MLAAILLVLLGLGGAAATAAPTGRAQQPGGEPLATCVRGEWQSTGVTTGGEDSGDVTLSGGEGVLLTVDEDGAATLDFSGMQPATFEKESDDTTVSGYVELRGEANGTIRTVGDRDGAGRLEVSELGRQDVEVTVALTEPITSRPLDRVPLSDLQELAARHGDGGGDMTPEVTYECGDDTLTITMSVEDDDDEGRHHAHGFSAVVWTFERPTATD